MRSDRRLLTLAVLVVAIGFSASAQADVAIVTVIDDTSADTFDVNLSLWSDGGVGVAATSGGLLDFAFESFTGMGQYTGVSTTNVSPIGEVTDGTDTYAAGFVNIRSDGDEANPVGLQPVAYAASGVNDPLRDAAVIKNVGIAAYTGGGTPSSGSWATEPAPRDSDVRLVSGSYTDNGGGSVGVTLFELDSFSVLPKPFVGPLTDDGTFGTAVTGIIVQTTTAGNSGGAAVSTVATTLRVDSGDVILGGSYQSGTMGAGATAAVANVSLQVTDPNVSVVFGGTGNHVFGGLDIQQANDGTQSVDVADAYIRVYDADPVGLAAAIKGMQGAGDGLHCSQLGTDSVLVVSAADDLDDGTAVDHVVIVATVKGDATLDRVTNDDDFFAVTGHWQLAGATRQEGDVTGDGVVNDDDFFAVTGNWQKVYFPTGGVVPEPATLSLLGFGLLAVLRRRRK